MSWSGVRALLRPRFTLGALLLLVSLCAFPLGYVSFRRAHNEARKAAFESLTSKGFSFELQLSQPVSAGSAAAPSSLERGWRTLIKEDVVPQFTSVTISDSRQGSEPASDDDLLLLAKFPEIAALSIQDAERLTDRGMEVVGKLPRLKYLSVLRSPKVTSAFLRHAPALEGLSLIVKFDPSDVNALQRHVNLRQLRIENAPVADRDLEFLGKCVQLDSLHLSGLPVNGSFLAKIDANAPMHFLTITGAPLMDRYVQELRRFPRLVHLDLTWTSLEGDFLPESDAERPAWPMMQVLWLQGTRFSDAGKSKLAQLRVGSQLGFPSNWSAIDFRRIEKTTLPPDFSINLMFAEEAKTEAIDVPVYTPPNFQPPTISNCPEEAMTPVKRLLEIAKVEDAAWKAKEKGTQDGK